MKSVNLWVSLSFCDASDSKLESTARKVLEHVYDNPAFPDVPVPASSLEKTITAFSAACEAHLNKGGGSARSERNARRIALLRLLQQVAFYVQSQCADDLPTLLSSGFEPSTPVHSRTKRLKGATPMVNDDWAASSLVTA